MSTSLEKAGIRGQTMSTKSTIWYGVDKGRELHIYWELAERVPHESAPIYLEIEADSKQVSIRLPKEVAQQVRDLLAPNSWEVM